MTTDDRPWEPPIAGTEAEALSGALDRMRWTFRWKADGLDPAGLQTRIGPSTLTLGGLLKHLALVEDHYFGPKLSGASLGPAWDAADWDADVDWEFTSAAGDAPAELYALYDGAVARSRAGLDAALSDGGLDQLVHLSGPDGRRANLRRLVCDLLEEYGRHTGQADLLREAVDGRVGEDPPDGWRPDGLDSKPAERSSRSADVSAGGYGDRMDTVTRVRPQLDLVVLDCPDALALGSFYAEVLGWEVEARSDEGFATVAPPGGGLAADNPDGRTKLAFQRIPDWVEPTWPGGAHPQQIHLDLWVPDIDAAEPAVIAAGARVHSHQPSEDGGFRVYRDPAGHPFCLITG